MVKDIPIPDEIFELFQPLVTDKEKLANLFSSLNCCVLCDAQKSKKDMPTKTTGQNSLDKYFTSKVNLNDTNNFLSEMGKKTANCKSITQMSNSSESETELPIIKTINQKTRLVEDDDSSSNGAMDFDHAPSKPILAAMNALGKLKQGIAEVTVEDNSSRDSTALVIDEGPLESEKDQSPELEESSLSKQPSKKINDGIPSPKNSKDSSNRNLSGKTYNKYENSHAPIENESFTQLFNVTKNTASSQAANKFSTSTPVEVLRTVKRKRSEGAESPEHTRVKRNKDKHGGSDSESLQGVHENLEDFQELKNFKDGDCPLFSEDLNSDEELYVVQCPKEMNPNYLVGRQLELNGESVMKLDVEGTIRHYECFSQKESLGRHFNIVLPSKNEGILKYGIYQMNGSLIISESVLDDPQLNSSENADTVDHSGKKQSGVQKDVILEKHKKHKKKQHVQNTSEDTVKAVTERMQVDNECSGSPIKKKKKRKEKSDEKFSSQESADVQIDLEKVTKKKRKDKEEREIMKVEESLLNEDGKKVKKKKQEKAEEHNLSARLESVEGEAPVKKKKKKKHRDEEIEPVKIEKELASRNINKEEVLSPQESNSDVSLKKKKKKKDRVAEEVEPVKFEKELVSRNINEEEVLSPQESNSNVSLKKKKKKKDKEKVDNPEHKIVEPIMESILNDEQPQKKKKKKKRFDQDSSPTVISLDEDTALHKENRHVVQDISMSEDVPNHLKLSSFIETDLQHIKKKKKKKKKEREKSVD